VLVLSRFVPTIHFGMLCAIIMITALIGDLMILPSVLLLKSQLAQNRDNV
jgi:predicted RND superfamily exporter protein